MNSACIIAACAANSRARRKDEEKVNNFIQAEELYYKVTLRKYYYFKPMTWSSPIEYNEYTNTFSMHAINIEAMTSATSQSFSVRASKCPNGIDAYIKDNLDIITTEPEWKASDAQVIADYCAEVK